MERRRRSRPPVLSMLVVCDVPPVRSGPGFDGNTLISAEILPRLAAIEGTAMTVAWFDIAGVRPDRAVLDAATRVAVLPQRPRDRRPSVTRLTQPAVVHERMSRTARNEIVRMSATHEVTLLHGLGTLGLATDVRSALVVNEVDPLSLHWFGVARSSRGAGRLKAQARAVRVRAVEKFAARHADAYVLINDADAREFSAILKRPVVAIPNGVCPAPAAPGTPTPGRLVFVGTLDYPPNVASARTLVRDVLPRVRQDCPAAHVVLVGRRPTAEVRALAGPHVQIAEDVPDVLQQFGEASLAVFPGGYGRGTRNSVLEALRAGCPVVASPASARGVTPNPGMLVTEDRSLPAATSRLLGRPDLLAEMRSAAWEAGQALPDWDAVAVSYHRLLTEVARPCRRRDDQPPPEQPTWATA